MGKQVQFTDSDQELIEAIKEYQLHMAYHPPSAQSTNCVKML